jgi:hypothetical protein
MSASDPKLTCSALGGMILSAFVHPWFYVLLAFELWQGRLLGMPDSVFGQGLLGIGIFNLVAGYFSAIALGTVAAARRGRLRLAAHALLMPAYWLAISYAPTARCGSSCGPRTTGRRPSMPAAALLRRKRLSLRRPKCPTSSHQVKKRKASFESFWRVAK